MDASRYNCMCLHVPAGVCKWIPNPAVNEHVDPHVNANVNLCILASRYLYTHVGVCYMYACMYECMYACIYACMHVCMNE